MHGAVLPPELVRRGGGARSGGGADAEGAAVLAHLFAKVIYQQLCIANV